MAQKHFESWMTKLRMPGRIPSYLGYAIASCEQVPERETGIVLTQMRAHRLKKRRVHV